MKQLLLVLAGVALLVTPALAQESPESAFRLYLAPEGVTGNDPLGGISPTQGNPALAAGSHRLYVWGQVLGTEQNQKYVSVGYNVVTTGDVTVDGASTWNYTNILQRWAVTNGGQLGGGALANVRLAGNPSANFGVSNSNPTTLDLQQDPTTNSTVLGYIDVSGTNGEVFLQVGDITIIRTGGTYDDVYLGFGDEGDGIKGNMVDAQSSIAEATIPEPASLMLLGLAGLALRRR